MEIVLEFEDIEELLREALKKRGCALPEPSRMKIRQNHKKGTIRVVFTTSMRRDNG